MPIRVLLADDTVIVLNAIRDILESDPEIKVVGNATSLKETLELTSRLKPHVIVLDLRIGDEREVPASIVKSRLAGSCLLAISIWAGDEMRELARNFGAAEYLDKMELGAELIPAIKRCMKHERVAD